MAAKRLSFAYGRTFLIGRLVLLVVLSGLVVVTIAITPSFPALTAGILVTILVIYGLVFVFSPLLTNHWLTRTRIILRQGWYFRAVVSFADIESVTRLEDSGRSRVPLGIHRPMGQPSLFVTAGRTGLISLQLRRPRRFWQSFGLFATEIVFDVTDPSGFLSAFEERRGSFAPVQADRAYADLRD